MTTSTYTSSTYTQADYQAADTSTKSTMRNQVAADIVAAVGNGDLAGAQALVAIQADLKAAAKSTVEVDYKQHLVDLMATLDLAQALVRSGQVTMPEGVDVPDLTDVDWTTGEPDHKLAEKMARVSGRKSGRGSVDTYIYEALGRVSGPATITQLAAAWVATSDYPKSGPSTGALGAAIKRGSDERWAACEVDGKAGAELI